MNIRQLESFHWIVRLGSFAAAAAKLNIAQSTISSRVKELEQSLGVSLFDRTERLATLTVPGRALIPLAHEMLGLSAVIKSKVGSPESLHGLVRIGVGEIAAMSWYPQLAQRLHDIYPGIETEVVVDLTIHLNQRLLEGKLDIGLVVGPPHPGLFSQSLGRTPMQWMAHPSLGLGKASVTATELGRHPILSLSRESHLYNNILNWFAMSGVRPKVIHGCSSVALLMALACNGSGVAILPTALAQSSLVDGDLIVLDVPSAIDHYEFFVVHDRHVTDPTVLAIADLATLLTTFEPA